MTSCRIAWRCRKDSNRHDCGMSLMRRAEPEAGATRLNGLSSHARSATVQLLLYYSCSATDTASQC